MILQFYKSSVRFYQVVCPIMSSIAHPRFVKESELVVVKGAIQKLLSNNKIVLASGSPRRQEILQFLGLDFVVLPSTFEENLNVEDFKNTAEFVKETAKQKALDVVEKIMAQSIEADLLISADTIVQLNNEIFGKPKNKAHAIEMLTRLSGNTHQVISGVTLIFPHKKDSGTGNTPFLHSFHDVTDVTVTEMSSEIIEQYVETGEPMDKAGAYGIQGKGNEIIKGLCGDYFNVVGFPVFKFHEELSDLYQNKITQ